MADGEWSPSGNRAPKSSFNQGPAGAADGWRSPAGGAQTTRPHTTYRPGSHGSVKGYGDREGRRGQDGYSSRDGHRGQKDYGGQNNHGGRGNLTGQGGHGNKESHGGKGGTESAMLYEFRYNVDLDKGNIYRDERRPNREGDCYSYNTNQ